MYNKYRNRKVNDKKVLHKVRKHWVVMSTALLMAIGGGALVANTNAHAATNPDDTDNNDNDSQLNNLKEGLNSTLVKNNQSMGSASSSATSTQSSSARIQDQARNLHTQILQNSIQHSNSSSNTSNTNSKALFGTQNVTNNHPVKRQLGDAQTNQNNNGPVDSVIYVQDYDSKTHMPIGDRATDRGHNGQPFLNQGFYFTLVPTGKGYTNPHIVGNKVTNYEKNNPQTLHIYWDPTSDSTPIENDYTIEYFKPRPGHPLDDGLTMGYGTSDMVTTDMNTVPDISDYTNINAINKYVNSNFNSPNRYHYNGQYTVGPSSDVGPTADGYDEKDIPISIGVSDGTNGNNNSSQNTSNPNTSNVPDNPTNPNTNNYTPQKHNVTGSDMSYTYYVDMSDGNKLFDQSSHIDSDVTGLSKAYYLNDAKDKVVNSPHYYNAGIVSDTTDNNGNQFITVGERKNRMTINYATGNNSSDIVSTLNPAVDITKRFNASKYEQEVPNGYRFTGQTSNVPSYNQNGRTVTIYITNKPKTDTMHIDYVDPDNNVVSQLSDTNDDGQPFNVNDYTNENKLPNNYQVDTSRVKNGIIDSQALFTPNGTVRIAVKKINAHMTVDYQSDGSTISSDSITGKNGAKFTFQPNVPANYHYVSDSNVPKTYTDGATIDVTVAKNPSDVTVPIVYVDKDKNTQVGTASAVGRKDSNFDPTQFEQDVPQGYTYHASDNKFTDIPQTYEPTDERITIYVTKNNYNPNPAPQIAHMTVSYQYQSDGQTHVAGTVPISDVAGQDFNVTPYEQDVPQGYNNGQVDQSTDPGKFVDGKTVVINVNQLPVTMTVNYKNGNQEVGSTTTTGVAGRTFDPTKYENEVPSGYQYNNGNVEGSTVYTAGKSVTIPVQPVTNTNNNQNKPNNGNNNKSQTGTITINYIDRATGQTVATQDGSFSVSDLDGKPFDPEPYEKNVPQGYSNGQISGEVPSKFIANDDQNVNIYVNKNSSNNGSNSATMNIYYQNVDTGSDANVMSANGVAGGNFDISSYENLIPAGYKFAFIAGNRDTVPTKYVNGANITLMVKKADNQSAPKIAHMTIDYINQGTNQSVGTIPISDEAGQSFKASNYTSTVPQGYDYANQVDDPTNGQFVDGDVVKVYVNPVQTPKVASDVSMPVNYVDQTTNQTVGRTVASGKAGSGFDPNSYEQGINNNGYVPAGYKVVSAGQNNPSNYTKGQSVTIYVTPKNQAPKVDHMTVNYVDPNGQTIDRVVASGNDGNQFDPSAYETSVSDANGYMPAGYKFVGNNDNLPTNYVDGQSVNIEVAPKTQAPKIVHMTISYQNSDGGAQIYSIPVTGTTDEHFDITPYTKMIPNNYQYDYVSQSSVPQNYTDNATPVIVVKESSTNQNTNNKPAQKIAHMTIHYQVNGSDIENPLKISDVAGNSFDWSAFKKNVPAGHSYNNATATDKNNDRIDIPSTFTDGDVITINLTDNQPKQSVTSYVQYVDDNGNGQPVNNEIPVTGIEGQPINLQPYENDVPYGYSYSGTNSTPYYYKSGQTITIPVNANDVTMPVMYINPSDNTVFDRTTTEGAYGSNFDVTPYKENAPEGYLPSGYTVTGVDGVIPKTYDSKGSVELYAKSTQPKAAKVIIKYLDASDNNNNVNKLAIDAHEGENFDIEPYTKTLPAGYENTSNDGKNIVSTTNLNSLSAGNNVVDILVKKVPSVPKIISMPVTYTFNGNPVGSAVAQGTSGSSFNDVTYEKNVPNGYYYDNGQVQAPSTYASDQSVTVPVNKYANGTITVNYVDANDHLINSSDNSVNVSDQITRPFDVTPYIKNVPQGYVYESIYSGNPKTFQSQTQTLDIEVKPAYATMNVQYVHDGKTVGQPSSTKIMGQTGQKITQSDLVQYETDVPYGYIYRGEPVSGAGTFENGKTISIDVDPIAKRHSKSANTYVPNNSDNSDNSDSSDSDNSRIVDIPVTYYSDAKGDQLTPVGYAVAQGFNGQVFDNIDTYTENVPQGYAKGHVMGVPPLNYKPNEQLNIIVSKNQPNGSNNNNSNNGNQENTSNDSQPVNKPQTVNMMLTYMSHSNVVGYNDTLQGIQGHSFDIDPYLMNQSIPQGYHYAGYVINGTNTYDAGRQIVVEVEPNNSNNESENSGNVNGNNDNYRPNVNPANEANQNGNSQLNNANMVVSYIYNGRVVGSNSDINGVQGSPFHLDPYLTNAPTGYQADYALNGTDHFENGKNIMVMVQPINSNSNNNGNNSTASTDNNQSNTPQIANMMITYMCNGNPVGYDNNVTGIAGQTFDVTPYEINVPEGYRNGHAVISPDEYENGRQIIIEVQPVNPNNNGGNQQNFNGNGQPNNSGDRTTNGNGSTSNGQPNTYNPTNTNSYSPNYDPTVNVYTNGQKENPNINDNGSGERPKTNRGANTDPNHEQNNNGSASDQNQSAANQPSNQHTANSSKSDHSSSNASSGIVINNNPVINNHPVNSNSNTNEMNGNGGGQPSGDNGSHNHSSVPSSNYPNGNSTASNGSQPGNSASTGNHQSQSQSQSQTVNVNGGGSTDGNGANHTSQPSNEANDSGSAGHQPMSNGGSGSTANNFNPQYNPNNSNSGNNQQSQSGYINGNGSRGGSANDNGSQASNSNHPSNTNDSSLDSANAIINNDNSEINSLESAEANRSNGNDSAMSSTMARQNSIIASLESEDSVLSKPSGKTDSTVNNYYQSIINDDNSEIASLAGRSGNSSGDNGSAIDNYYQSIINNDTSQIASLESASANAAKNTGSGQNDSSMDSSMNRQTSIINSLESQATSTSNTDATTDNSYNSAIASLNSKLTSITNSANSENAAQNNRGQSQSSQSSTSSSGSKSSARASNSQPSGSNDSSVDSLSSEVASLKNRLNHQSSGPTTVNNYYGSGSSNNNVPSNGTQSGSTTNNYNPNNTFSPTNNQYPNSGDSTASNSSSQGIQQKGSTNSQPSASNVSHRSTKPGRRKADNATTTTKRRRVGNKKANRRGAKTANDFNDLSLNSTDGRNFGNSVSHRNSRGTSSTPDNLSDGFGDAFNDGLNHRITADQNNATRRGRLPQTGESTNDRELAAIGSILAIVGTGLSQLGYALKRRRRRHFYADRRYDRYEN